MYPPGETDISAGAVCSLPPAGYLFGCIRVGTERPKCCRHGFRSMPLTRARLDGDTIILVKNRPVTFTRRKLAAVVRKAIISYYTEQEKEEVRQAAKRERVSISSFVASSAIKEARRLNHKSQI
jgi:hypothetical protein